MEPPLTFAEQLGDQLYKSLQSVLPRFGKFCHLDAIPWLGIKTQIPRVCRTKVTIGEKYYSQDVGINLHAILTGGDCDFPTGDPKTSPA